VTLGRSRRCRAGICTCPDAAAWSKIRHVRRNLERCAECTPAARCVNHQACATRRDASLASEIGAAWAVFVRGQVDVRQPWPPFSGRAAAIALRLVAALAPEPRRSELARICHWRAGLKWEALERPRIRDRPYETLDGRGILCERCGSTFARDAGHRPRPNTSTPLMPSGVAGVDETADDASVVAP